MHDSILNGHFPKWRSVPTIFTTYLKARFINPGSSKQRREGLNLFCQEISLWTLFMRFQERASGIWMPKKLLKEANRFDTYEKGRH